MTKRIDQKIKTKKKIEIGEILGRQEKKKMQVRSSWKRAKKSIWSASQQMFMVIKSIPTYLARIS